MRISREKHLFQLNTSRLVISLPRRSIDKNCCFAIILVLLVSVKDMTVCQIFLSLFDDILLMDKKKQTKFFHLSLYISKHTKKQRLSLSSYQKVIGKTIRETINLEHLSCRLEKRDRRCLISLSDEEKDLHDRLSYCVTFD